LLEPQRTNVSLESETITAGTGTTVTLNTTTAPTGLNTADKLVEDTSNGVHLTVFGGSLGGPIDSSVYSVSVFAKAAGRTRINIFDNNQATGGLTNFDIANGVVISGSGRIENYGNGWFRCTIFPAKTNSNVANCQIRLINTGTNVNYTGDGTSGAFIWGKQIEPNATYPTTYIPTTTAAVTRLGDSTFKAGLSSLFGTEGTWFIEMSPSSVGVSTTAFKKVIGLFQVNNSIADCIYLEEYIGTWGVFVRKGNATIVSRTYGTQPRKLAVTFGATGSKIYIDGVQAASTASNTSISPIQISTTQNAGSAIETVLNVSQMAYFTTPLTDAQLVDLTGGRIYYNPVEAYYAYYLTPEIPSAVITSVNSFF
jgi:hypothetical protein